MTFLALATSNSPGKSKRKCGEKNDRKLMNGIKITIQNKLAQFRCQSVRTKRNESFEYIVLLVQK